MQRFWNKYFGRKTGNRGNRIVAKFIKAAAIPPLRKSLTQLNREIARSRRFQHPLAIISIGLNGNYAQQIGMNADDVSLVNHAELLLFGTIFRDALREIDISSYDGAKKQFVIALPETTKLQAIQAVARLKHMVGAKISNQLVVGIAEFPKDGLILHELLDYAKHTSSTSKVQIEG